VDRWIRVLILSVGGALGVNALYWLGLWMSRWVDPRFPWAIFITNVSGSFGVGFLVALMTRWLPHPYFRLLVVAGFLGGYTTFSTFAFDSLTLWEEGERGRSLANMFGSVTAGVAAVAIGATLARGIVEQTPRDPKPVTAKTARATSRRTSDPGTTGHRGISPDSLRTDSRT
jgi:CrcB protein